MAEAIEYEQFEQTGHDDAIAGSEADISRLSDIPMELSVEIGRAHMTVGETLDLGVGSVVALERLAGETADLLVNGTAIARGEVVVVDEQYGLRVTEILNAKQEDDTTVADEGTALGGEADQEPTTAEQHADVTDDDDGAAVVEPLTPPQEQPEAGDQPEALGQDTGAGEAAA